jgi:hypothetical protein
VVAVDDADDAPFSALGGAEARATEPYEGLRALREEVATLREDVAAMGAVDERTAEQLSELTRAVDGLSATLDQPRGGRNAGADD